MNTDDRLSVPANATSAELRAWVETLRADELRIVLERLGLSLSGIVPVLRTRLMTAVDPAYAAERQAHGRKPRRDNDFDTERDESVDGLDGGVAGACDNVDRSELVESSLRDSGVVGPSVDKVGVPATSGGRAS